MSVAATALDELQIDALREVANIGAGHAVTSLSALTDRDFRMSVPSFGVVALHEFAAVVGHMEEVAAAVYMPVEGDVSGHVAFLFPFDCACRLCDVILCREPGDTQRLDEMECSVLAETGNILISSFLNAIADMSDLRLPSAPPGIAVDMAGAILASIAAASPSLGDHALTIMTRLADREQPIEGVFVFIPEPESLGTLLRAIGLER
ncbi:MAG TPA: chemotaxis protein CheC [Chthonomonadales bacterium]|nr:chemotaxis protein CheC [Chthonomonadales bacterium]